MNVEKYFNRFAETFEKRERMNNKEEVEGKSTDLCALVSSGISAQERVVRVFAL